jgi:hypothetical protein
MPSFWRVSWMSTLRIVSWPMRSAGVNAPSTSSMVGRSGWSVRLGLVVSMREQSLPRRLQRHLGGNGTHKPALGGLAQHQALRVEPACSVSVLIATTPLASANPVPRRCIACTGALAAPAAVVAVALLRVTARLANPAGSAHVGLIGSSDTSALRRSPPGWPVCVDPSNLRKK